MLQMRTLTSSAAFRFDGLAVVFLNTILTCVSLAPDRGVPYLGTTGGLPSGGGITLIVPPSGGGTAISRSMFAGGGITIPAAGASPVLLPDDEPTPGCAGIGARSTGGGFSSIFSGIVVFGAGCAGGVIADCARTELEHIISDAISTSGVMERQFLAGESSGTSIEVDVLVVAAAGALPRQKCLGVAIDIDECTRRTIPIVCIFDLDLYQR